MAIEDSDDFRPNSVVGNSRWHLHKNDAIYQMFQLFSTFQNVNTTNSSKAQK